MTTYIENTSTGTVHEQDCPRAGSTAVSYNPAKAVLLIGRIPCGVCLPGGLPIEVPPAPTLAEARAALRIAVGPSRNGRKTGWLAMVPAHELLQVLDALDVLDERTTPSPLSGTESAEEA